jgi:Ser/Thr protein kinase RdoA (MazF antagonist)
MAAESNSMNAEWNKIAELIPRVLRSWNITPDDVTPISRSGNSHWRVRRGREDFVLRMYRRGQSEPSIQYELDILKRLRSQGWPVAAAVEETVLHFGFIFALFPLLPGCPHQEETAEQRRRRGRILGELHRELSAATDVGQRAEWQRADEVVRNSETRHLRGNDMHRTIALDLERVRDRLLAADASSFPVAVIHGDFIAQNLLFQGEALSGVLDFDSVHLDLRAADVACARRSRLDDVVRGYLEIAPLTDAELRCLDDLWRATVLRYALQILGGRVAAETDEPELQWCVKQLEKTMPFDG